MFEDKSSNIFSGISGVNFCILHSYVATFYLGIRTSIRMNMKQWHSSQENRKTYCLGWRTFLVCSAVTLKLEDI